MKDGRAQAARTLVDDLDQAVSQRACRRVGKLARQVLAQAPEHPHAEALIQLTAARTDGDGDGDGDASPRDGGSSKVGEASSAVPPGVLAHLARRICVGRAAERALLRDAMDNARMANGSLVLLEGEPGIGKTRLLEDAQSYARLCGFEVLTARCVADRGAPPFWPWLQALRPYVERTDADVLQEQLAGMAAVLADLVPEIAVRVRPGTPPQPLASAEAARFRLFDTVARFLDRIAAASPVALVIEDLDSSDEPSLELLLHVARNIDRSRILVLAAARNPVNRPADTLARAVSELVRLPRTSRMTMQSWNGDDTATYLELVAARRLPGAVAEHLHRLTRGVPLFVAELAQLIADQGPLDGPGVFQLISSGPLPSAVRDVIRRRLGQLSATANALLQHAAVIGVSFDAELLAAVAEQPPELVWDELEAAAGLQLLEPHGEQSDVYSFQHRLTQLALLEDIPRRQRARVHGRVAGYLQQRHGVAARHASEVLRHLELAGDFAAREELVTYATAAGDHALAVYALPQAGDFYQRALDLLGTETADEDTARLWFALARVHADSPPMRREATPCLLRAFEIYAALGDGGHAVEVALFDAEDVELLHRTAEDPRVADMRRRALAMVGQGSEHHALLLSRYADALSRSGGDAEAAERAFQEALGIAERLAAPQLQAAVLGRRAYLATSRSDHSRAYTQLAQAVTLARNAGDLNLVQRLLNHASAAAMRAGESMLVARELAGEAVLLAERLGDPLRLSTALYGLEGALSSLCEFDAAREASDRALAFSPPLVYLLWCRRALLELANGDAAACEQYVARFLVYAESEAPGDLYVQSSAALYLADFVELLDHDAWRAVARTAAARVLSDPRASSEVRFRALSGAMKLAALGGDRAEARRLYRLAGDHPANAMSHVRMAEGALTAELFDDAMRHAARAWDIYRGQAYHRWVPHCGNVLARAVAAQDAVDIDTPGNARAIAEEALSVARQYGMPLWAEKLETLLRELNAPDESALPDGITRREADVLRLVAGGLSNKMVAQELSLSSSTVATHLRSAYAKAGLANRADAAAYALRHGLVQQ